MDWYKAAKETVKTVANSGPSVVGACYYVAGLNYEAILNAVAIGGPIVAAGSYLFLELKEEWKRQEQTQKREAQINAPQKILRLVHKKKPVSNDL